MPPDLGFPQGQQRGGGQPRAQVNAAWPYEITRIYGDNRNGSQGSKNAWKALYPPQNYRDLPKGWQQSAQYLGTGAARVNPPSDNYLWEYVFGQKNKDGSPAGRPGYATVEQLNANFNMSGRSRADVPVIVAFHVEKSATAFEWRGEGAPEGGSMTALVPTQLGFSYFDPMRAAEPNNDAKDLGAKNWGIAKGRPITAGDRGKVCRSCGMFQTSHFCLEAEAQCYHTNGNIPPWVRSKAMFSDSGVFSFKEIVTMKMKDARKNPSFPEHTSLHGPRKGRDLETSPHLCGVGP